MINKNNKNNKIEEMILFSQESCGKFVWSLSICLFILIFCCGFCEGKWKKVKHAVLVSWTTVLPKKKQKFYNIFLPRKKRWKFEKNKVKFEDHFLLFSGFRFTSQLTSLYLCESKLCLCTSLSDITFKSEMGIA